MDVDALLDRQYLKVQNTGSRSNIFLHCYFQTKPLKNKEKPLVTAK